MAIGSVPTFHIGWIEVSLGLSLLFLYFCYTWTSAYAYWKRRNVPFLKPKFPFGNFTDVLLFKKNFVDSWTILYDDIGTRPFCGVYSMKTPVLVVKDPALIKQILTKDFSFFTDHGVITSTDHEPLLNNLFQLEGERWKQMRTKLAPAFSGGKMKMMFPITNGCAHQLKLFLENVCNDTGTFEVKDLMSRFAVDVIINSAFGLNATSVNDPNCNFYKTGKQMFERSFKRMFSTVILFQSARIYSLLKLHFLGYEACEYFGELIKRTMQDREKKNITRNDFVDILVRLKNNLSIDDADMFTSQNTDSVKRLANGAEDIGKSVEGITMTELLAQALSFFFAGFESTSNTLSFCLYELSKRPDLQLKLQQEVDAALERHGSFTYQMMQELPYIDNVINETLRRYTALATLDRICVKPYKIPGTDIIIEKGCKVAIPTYALHHDPRYYPDPFKFDPDRFLEENVKSRPSYTFMPFGEGPRLCIGMRFARMEMRMALATIFSEFTCKLNPRTAVPLTISCGEIVTSTRDEILIDLSRRNKLQ